eukprot:TRINITY_DN382_c5_g1_i1.p1 TRINITY_DN382_c5_g1~~TRINITY_DN382_c5_g1_i1.p1  ORF type:complete len:430 (+),score=82.83 TRINITY_DN382_c5_g1_i1:105-1292(+)
MVQKTKKTGNAWKWALLSVACVVFLWVLSAGSSDLEAGDHHSKKNDDAVATKDKKKSDPVAENPSKKHPKKKKKEKVALATYVHKGSYDRGFSGSFEGMLDNIAVMTSQVNRFKDEMEYEVELLVLLTNTSYTLAPLFEKLGWHVRVVDLPIQPNEIRNKQIAKEVVTDGAIGIWEMIKLEVWRPSLTKDIGVSMILLIDTDIHLRQPFDKVFQPPWMGLNATLGYTAGAWVIEKVNGGYLVIRPSEESEKDYHAIYEILREGDFRSGTGWRGKVGWTYGGRTMQGLLPYYYLFGDGKDRSTLIPRCNVNNMVNSDACKPTDPATVISNHFTGGCMKPWTCSHVAHSLCKSFTNQWWDDVGHAEKFLSLPHRRRCPGNTYESMSLRTSDWHLPEM